MHGWNTGGAKGPGIFFVIPCIDSYHRVDLRTVSFDVPPQEVSVDHLSTTSHTIDHRSLCQTLQWDLEKKW